VLISTIKGFQLSIISPEEIKAGSVLEIKTVDDLNSPLWGLLVIVRVLVIHVDNSTNAPDIEAISN